MTNALDLAKAAVSEWRRNRGNQTTYLKCQHFDGWYMQWAYEGFTRSAEQSIRVYPSASAAARDSEIFTRNVNDPSIQPGDLVYWNWGKDGHVASVIGRDGGRVLVTHTSHSGDNLMDLGNNVRVSHADTISLDVYGVSHTNGRNKRRSGLSGYNINQGGGSPAPAAGGSGPRIDLRAGWAWYTSPDNARNEWNPHGPTWTGEKLARGVYNVLEVTNSGIKIQANDGSHIWISPKAGHLITGGGPAPEQAFADTSGADWIFYESREDALAARNQKRFLPRGQHRIDEGSGPYKVYIGAGWGPGWDRHVWVGSSRTQPPVIYK